MLDLKVPERAVGKLFLSLHAVEQVVDDRGGAHGRLSAVEILERADLLGGGRRDDETEGTLCPARMGRRENHGLGNAALILSEDVHQIAEMPVKAARTHGGTKFESRLEGNHLNVKPSGLEQLLVGRGVDHNGVGGWKHTDAKGLGVDRRRNHRAGSQQGRP